MNIGNSIKRAGIKKGYSQLKLAEMVGVTGISIIAYEKGVELPNINILVKLMGILDLELKVSDKEDSTSYPKAIDIINNFKPEFDIYCNIVGESEEKIKSLVEKITYLVQYETYLEKVKKSVQELK